jgi:hypothetical protein
MRLSTLRRYLGDRVVLARSWLAARTERDRATAYWASLREYHEVTDADPTGFVRSEWIAQELIPELGIESLLEIGTNTGRNLAVAKDAHPDLRVCGTDVNPHALARARELRPHIEFRLQDANRWNEPPKSWDAVLTMSVLDHVPDEAIEALARNIVSTARKAVIAVEFWDGSEGKRGPYKYSRDTRALFERAGARTLRWEESPGQYDRERSLLWAYVGAVD